MFAVTMKEIRAFCGGKLLNLPEKTVVNKAETDSRKDIAGGIFFALKGERFDGHDFLQQAITNNAAVLCVEKGREIPDFPCWCVSDTLKAYQQLGAFMLRKAGIPALAVTGSVGKTSVKEMVRAMLEYKFGKGSVLYTEGNTNNHIGVPQNLLRLTPAHKICVIEMGTSSFGEISVLSEIVRPGAALINSIAPCHLENLGSLDGVAKEKSSIFDYASDLAVFPGNIPQSPHIAEAAGQRGLKIKTFGTENDEDVDFYYSHFSGGIMGSAFNLHHGGRKIRIKWNLQGEHQAQNACGAAALGLYAGMSFSAIAAGLSRTELPGLRARITEKNGVNYYNDAYNANPASMRALIKMIRNSIDHGDIAEKDVILVIGDMLELGINSPFEHRNILSLITECLPEAKVLAAGKIYKQFSRYFKMNFFDDAMQAGEYLRTVVDEGKWVFLKGSRSMHMEDALKEE